MPILFIAIVYRFIELLVEIAGGYVRWLAIFAHLGPVHEMDCPANICNILWFIAIEDPSLLILMQVALA